MNSSEENRYPKNNKFVKYESKSEQPEKVILLKRCLNLKLWSIQKNRSHS